MTNPAQTLAMTTATSVAAHNARIGWDIADGPHAYHMMLVDMIALAAVAGLNFDAEVAAARETFADSYAAADLRPVMGIRDAMAKSST